MCDGELVSVFIWSQEPDFYDRMLSMAGRPFAELVKIGEAIENGLQYRKIVSIFNKASGKTTAGIFRRKKEDEASISHIPNPSPKEPQSSRITLPLINYSTHAYNPTHVHYAQQSFTTTIPSYKAQPSVRMSASAYQTPPQQTYQPPRQQNYHPPQNNPPQAYPPQNDQNQPPPPTYNAPRPSFERKPTREFKRLLEPRAQLFERLLVARLIQKVLPKPA
ncbi:uncharacterized protein LOC132630931 [Lycium barbarum]|uniref:uncharacterized protein LOC132630931 n=1 Tax=Lycium barbarum TaxID=112863 RepID=UPI00293F63F4|nr:uncharacterized protein LOC132630931 [Lycium barbarum]